MDLDFETNKYDLFDDWHQNKTKQAFTQKLQQQAQIEKTLVGSTQHVVNTKSIASLKVKIPNLTVQKQYCDFVHQVDKSKVAVQKALDEAQMLFDSLMQKYFG